MLFTFLENVCQLRDVFAVFNVISKDCVRRFVASEQDCRFLVVVANLSAARRLLRTRAGYDSL